MFPKIQIIIFLFILIINGCSSVPNFSGLFNLKRLAANQQEIEKYLEEEERLFNELLEDIKNNQLSKGIPKEELLAAYAEPILIKPISGQDKRGEVFYYYHPSEPLSNERAYLYFDQDGLLDSWELQP